MNIFREYVVLGGKRNIPVMMGTFGRYLEIRRAVLPLVESTRIALAFCSEAAATAAMDTVSTVCVGRGWRSRSSSYKGG
jgi:FAD/FMN-containing dehydrogenase